MDLPFDPIASVDERHWEEISSWTVQEIASLLPKIHQDSRGVPEIDGPRSSQDHRMKAVAPPSAPSKVARTSLRTYLEVLDSGKNFWSLEGIDAIPARLVVADPASI